MGEILFDGLFWAGIRFLVRLFGCEQTCEGGAGLLLLVLLLILFICVVVLVVGHIRKPAKKKGR